LKTRRKGEVPAGRRKRGKRGEGRIRVFLRRGLAREGSRIFPSLINFLRGRKGRKKKKKKTAVKEESSTGRRGKGRTGMAS